MSETKIKSSLSSKFKKTQVNSVQKLPDITGHTLGEFYVDSRLDIVSGEADIYLCTGTGSLSGKTFLLKYYRRENAVKPDVLEKLKGVNSPFVAPVESFGEYMGHQYVIRPYYEMSALSELLSEGTRFSEEELTTLIIPSIIEGLKVVHDAGILHKDLKPANLIPDDSGEHIVLIDFGISSDAGKNTFVVTQTGMTPFYAAPEAMHSIFHKETDYYALGITIFELFTGFTPFQNPELTPEEAAKLASVSQIEFPANFPEALKKLVLGLTYKDISHRNEKNNPNRRWGYDEVRRWLNGEDVPVPGEIPSAPGFIARDSREAGASPASGDPFQAYRFNGKTYTAETDLLRAMLEQPVSGLKDLGRGFLSHHYYAFSEKKGTLCEYAEKKLTGKDSGNHWANTRILYALIYSLNPNVREIGFNGRILNTVQDLGRAFIDAAAKEALQNHDLRGQSYPLTRAVKEFVVSGIPEDYAVTVLKNTAVKDLFSKTAAIWKNSEHAESDTELALILGYSLCDDRRLPIGGKIYESPEAFRNEMASLVSKDRSAYMKLIDAAKADLDFLEKNLPDTASREVLSRALNDAKWSVFGDNEYHFKNGQDFQNYIQKLVNEEKPYEIRSLLNRYKSPLKKVSEKVWGTDSLNNLQKTVAGFIQIGEYLFTGEPAFRDFITGVMERGRMDPAYLLSFVKAHWNSLDSAAKAFPVIKENVDALYAANDAVIVFDEEMFPDLLAFKAFITAAINRGNTDPGYFLEFVKRHRSTINSLMKNPKHRAVLKPLTDAAESLIVLGCRIFSTVDAFESYINEVIAVGRNDPGFLCRFVRMYGKEFSELRRDSRCKSILSDLYAVRNEMVSLDELVFRTANEFRGFMEHLLSTGKENPAYILRFVREHEKALKALKNVSVLSSVVSQVLMAGNSIIELDEYVFSDAAGLTGFARELMGENMVKPLRSADFVREHKAGLEALKSADALAPAVKELEAMANAREKGEAIMINGTRYTSGLTKGEYIEFGSYPQNNGRSKEPIEWLVLEVNGNEVFLVSRYGLDCKYYHLEWSDITWENCDLRKWLNGEFLNAAFSEEEQQRIKLSEVVNDNNPEYRTLGGNYTWDRVFCLSLAEAERYFKNDNERMCRRTARAIAHRAYSSDDGYCWWWLRSPGGNQHHASGVDTDGALYPSGHYVSSDGNAVRPALRLIWNPESDNL